MLLALRLRDFVIVDELELVFEPGFSVLTGETGAGKSILIDALGLLLGDRTDAGVVRQGAERAELAADFGMAGESPLIELLNEAGLDGDGDVCLLRRTIDANGRSRAWVNGHPATVAQLKLIGEYLVDIHGQHAHQRLVRPDAQRELLDTFCGQTALARQVRQAWEGVTAAQAKLDAAMRNAEAYANERDRLQWQIKELTSVGPKAGEWEEIQLEQSRLSHAQSLIAGTQAALSGLVDDDNCVDSRLGGTIAVLEDLLAFDEGLGETVEFLRAAQANVDEAAHALRRYADRLELDPARLQQLEQRMDELYRVARKYRLEVSALPARLDEWHEQLKQLGGNSDIEQLESALRDGQREFKSLATQLSAARQQGAGKLGSLVSEEMQKMAMAGSRFEIVLIPLAEPSSSGLESIEFRVAPHAASDARSLAKVASGGELSRISLALQVVASQSAHVPTLIFDEVDVGIGGRVAETVGKLLAQLGGRHQVLCITHLPQVAACASTQFQVSKNTREDGVRSQIVKLDHAARIEEIARMLAGSEITRTVRQHATEMLSGHAVPEVSG